MLTLLCPLMKNMQRLIVFFKAMCPWQFGSNDHTAVIVPVFYYGPRREIFKGVCQNTELNFKILQLLNSR
jgi:alkaline phosphatase